MKKAICLVVLVMVAISIVSCSGGHPYGERYEAIAVFPIPVYETVYEVEENTDLFGQSLVNTKREKIICFVWWKYDRTDYLGGSTAAKGTCVGDLK